MKYVYLIFLMFFCSSNAIAQNSRIILHEANEAYAAGDFKKAAALYRNAHQADAKNTDALMGLGNSLQKLGQNDEAVTTFRKAQEKAQAKDQKAFLKYNAGNALAEKGNIDEALKAYREALLLQPGNELIKKNYQIALSKKNNNNKSKDNNQNSPQDQQDPSSKNNPKDQNGEPQDPGGKDQNPNMAQNGGQNKGKDGDGQGNQPKPKHQNGQIPEDQRKKMLGAIKNRESETASRILNKNAYYEPESKEKDW